MADQFTTPISTSIQGLGYTTKICTEPNRRVWDSLPVVTISPVKKDIDWIAFGGDSQASRGFKNVVSQYQLVYIEKNDLNTAPSTTTDVFEQNMFFLFMGNNASLSAAGAWNVWIVPENDYDRKLLPEGYSYTSMIVHIAWIQNNA